ncbi:MAG TPA: helix-turn-helix domain-containing protein [Planctomycetota bacterium]|nr:helix-turn-helix domain-containing protein [Planctomycetota bacterium]
MARGEPKQRTRYSTGELAELVEASRNTIVRYIEEGRIRARRSVGGWYIIPREEVLMFLWDLSFSKQTPLKMWRAATLAYERMSEEDQAAKAAAPAPARRRRPKAKR